jgi:N-acetylglucosaminyldiphosphoundecaprenol N-acetyl-beta-D-mannosaminyltransferase
MTLLSNEMKEVRSCKTVIGTPIDAIDWITAISRISHWAGSGLSRVVCICNSHSVVTARSDPDFASVLRNADMATPDGAPVAWLLSIAGANHQERINGPDLMWKYCSYAEDMGEVMYFYGATDETLQKLVKTLKGKFPRLRIGGYYSPPFRALTSEEDDAIVNDINDSGAGVVWVSLGCPKQEKWMHAHRGRIRAVMIGVGAAFDYHAGTIRRAPLWMQRNGLEWLHRLASEPRRLWRRYLVTNTLFIWYATAQLIKKVLSPAKV